jgi:microcystin degradation protein MlrC
MLIKLKLSIVSLRTERDTFSPAPADVEDRFSQATPKRLAKASMKFSHGFHAKYSGKRVFLSGYNFTLAAFWGG